MTIVETKNALGLICVPGLGADFSERVLVEAILSIIASWA